MGDQLRLRSRIRFLEKNLPILHEQRGTCPNAFIIARAEQTEVQNQALTDYTHVATIGIGVAAVATGAYFVQTNMALGGTLVAIGLGILGYKAAKNSGNGSPTATTPN